MTLLRSTILLSDYIILQTAIHTLPCIHCTVWYIKGSKNWNNSWNISRRCHFNNDNNHGDKRTS